MRGVLCRAVGGLVQARGATRTPARSLFWWGHDTIQDQEERRREAAAKGIISWTDPESALDEKKEFVWAPMRIKDELNVALTGAGTHKQVFNPADYMHWWNNKVCRPYLPMAVLDPTWFVEETKQRYHKYLVRSQMFVPERLTKLGPDLAAAHFLCYNNCRVRFKGHTHWTELSPKRELDIPALYVKGWCLEAIDAASSLLVYEGLQNLRNLHHLKHLDLSYCEYIDEWCMDRITGEYHHSLEYLNISGCTKMNWNGLEVIWRCRNLKVLVIKDMEHVQDLQLICLMLLDVIPNLKIQGAEYMDLKLLEGTEFQDLLADDGSVPRIEAGELEEEQEAKEQTQEARSQTREQKEARSN